MDLTDFIQTMPPTSGAKIASSEPSHTEFEFDDTFGDFNEFEEGDVDFVDFVAGTATSSQPFDDFGTYHHDVNTKLDFHATEQDEDIASPPYDDTRQTAHNDKEVSPTLETQLTNDETVRENHDYQDDVPDSVNVDNVSGEVESDHVHNSDTTNQASPLEQRYVEAKTAVTESDLGTMPAVSSPATNAEEQDFGKVNAGSQSTSDIKTETVSPVIRDVIVMSIDNEDLSSGQSKGLGFSDTVEDRASIEDGNMDETNSKENVSFRVLDETDDQGKVDTFGSPNATSGNEDVTEFGSFDATGDQDKVDDFGSPSPDTTIDQNKAADFGWSDDENENKEFAGFAKNNYQDKDDEFGSLNTTEDEDQTDEFDEFGTFNDNAADNDDFGEFGEFDTTTMEDAPASPPSDNDQHTNQPVVATVQEIPANIRDAIIMSDFGDPDGASAAWDAVLAHIIPNASDYNCLNATQDMQTVKDIVMDAHESLLPTITWHALTVNTDDDNGIPKVQWRNSRIEKMYLDALKCWRGQTITSPTFASPKSFSRMEKSPPTTFPKSVASKAASSDAITSPTITMSKVDIPKAQSFTVSPNMVVESKSDSPVSVRANNSKSPSTKLDEPLSPTLEKSPSLPKIATSKLPSSDSAPTSAASVRSFDMPTISQVVNQTDISTRQLSQQTQAPIIPRQSESPDHLSTGDSSSRPSTPTQSPKLTKKRPSLGDARERSPSPTQAPNTFRSIASTRPLTPTRFNPQSQVSSPGSTATPSTPIESSPNLNQSRVDMSTEILASSSAEPSVIPEAQPVISQPIDIVNSPPSIEHPQTALPPVTSPPVSMSETTDSWLSSNDMCFLDALGGTMATTKSTLRSAAIVSESPKYNSMDMFAEFEQPIGNVPVKPLVKSSTMPDILQRPNSSLSQSSLQSYGSQSSSTTPSTPAVGKQKLQNIDIVDKPLASPSKSASMPPVSPSAFTNSSAYPHNSLSPSTVPSGLAAPEKRDSWLSANDISFLDSFGSSFPVPAKNDGGESNIEFSDFVSQSPMAIPTEQPKVQAVQTQPSTHLAPKMQPNRLSQASLSPVTSPSAPATEKRDSWLSSNDISFLDTLGGVGGNMTSKPNSKPKQIGLGIMDLDMFEANSTVQSGPKSRPTQTAKVTAKDIKQTKQGPSHYEMPGAILSSRSPTSISPPSWPSNNTFSRQNQPLSALQSKRHTATPSSGKKNLFDGLNDFGDFTGSNTTTQTILSAARSSSPEDAKWDIFRSASMSGSLSEWSSSLRSPPISNADKIQQPELNAMQSPVNNALQPFNLAPPVSSAPPAFDDFGDFTTATADEGDEFGDFGSPDTTWNNDQSFSSSNGWL